MSAKQCIMAKSARSNNKKHLRQVRRDRMATTEWVTGAAAERAAKMQAIVAAPLASRLVHYPYCLPPLLSSSPCASRVCACQARRCLGIKLAVVSRALV